MVHENWRFRRALPITSSWLDAGDLGEPVSASCRCIHRGCWKTSGRPPATGAPAIFCTTRAAVDRRVADSSPRRAALAARPAACAPPSEPARLCPRVQGEDHAVILLEGRERWALLDGNLATAGAPPTPSDRLELVGTKGSALFENNSALARLSEKKRSSSISPPAMATATAPPSRILRAHWRREPRSRPTWTRTCTRWPWSRMRIQPRARCESHEGCRT